MNKKFFVPALALALVAGAGLGISTLTAAHAADTTTAATAVTAEQNASSTGQASLHTGNRGPHTANGKTETLLTGSDAEKATAAALAAVPGGTVVRVESDADGDAYEAHMTNASGADVTVKFDSSFGVLRIETGHGPRQ